MNTEEGEERARQKIKWQGGGEGRGRGLTWGLYGRGRVAEERLGGGRPAAKVTKTAVNQQMAGPETHGEKSGCPDLKGRY